MSELRQHAGELVTQLELSAKKARAVAQEAWIAEQACEASLGHAKAKREKASHQSDRLERALIKAQAILSDLDNE